MEVVDIGEVVGLGVFLEVLDVLNVVGDKFVWQCFV